MSEGGQSGNWLDNTKKGKQCPNCLKLTIDKGYLVLTKYPGSKVDVYEGYEIKSKFCSNECAIEMKNKKGP